MYLRNVPPILLLAVGVSACQSAQDDVQFRSTYTTDVTLSGGDDGPACLPDEDFDINPRRSLFESHEEALAPFTMEAMLHAVATNSSLVSQPATTHDQFVDIYNPGPGLGLGQHCDDEVAFDGTPGINGYPLECGRDEGDQIGNIAEWFPIGAVNRFDLAPSDGSNCGEARIVLANNAQNRMFTIFEAQVPNPDPSCGLDACVPVQRFWANLSNIDDPAERALELEQAFLSGHPDLLDAGIGPFISQANLTFGTGQIRTNNFDEGPWTLREFKAIAVKKPSIKPPIKPGIFEPAAELPALEEPVAAGPISGVSKPFEPATIGLLRIVEVPVAANPFGDLWNDTLALPNDAKCRDAFVNTVQHLMNDDPNLMAVAVPSECLAAESPNDFSTRYDIRLAQGSSGATSLTAAINAEIAAIDPASSLDATDIARRAAFSGSCIGCHQETNGLALGNGVNAPSSAGFVHTNEFSFEDCGDGDTQCFFLSSALKTSFLPHREQVMETYLNSGPCCTDDEIGPIGVDPIDPIPHPFPTEPLPTAPMEADEVDVESLLEAEAVARSHESPTTVAGTPTARSH